MITVNSSPVTNKILLDSNDTLISITSSNGAGYYFRAKIFIDDVLFDEQSWSRKDNFTAEKNLKKLYNAYFESVFTSNFTNGLVEQTHLKKKVSITIEERLMNDDSLIQVKALRDYYIFYNAVPVLFNETVKASFLGVDASRIVLPTNGKISIPIYTNTSAESIVVTLKNNFNTVLDTVTIPSDTAKKVFLYNFDLSALTLVNNTIYFVLTVVVGGTTITKTFRYLEFPDYPVKEIAFRNNFGFYIYAYLDGQLTIDNQFDPNTYEQNDGSEKVFEIDENYSYTINTGSLLSSEKSIINQIAASLDAKLFYKSEWLDINTTTRKVREYQDRQNNYSESLQFTAKKTKSISNDLGMTTGVYDSDYYSSDYLI